jgi:hypothetical protein
MEVQKKKRGRKPKNIIQSTEKKNIIPNKINDNLIIKVKISNKRTNNNEIINGYIEDSNFSEYDHNNSNCWNCCHLIQNRIHGIPIKYDNNIFYIYGNFCCNSCSLRYILDNFSNKELWNKYKLFSFYNRIVYDKEINIKIPPNRLSIDVFGGNLTIDEYRNIDNHDEINLPLIIPIKNNPVIKENFNNVKNKTDLKLYRKPKKEKTIFDDMNIK